MKESLSPANENRHFPDPLKTRFPRNDIENCIEYLPLGHEFSPNRQPTHLPSDPGTSKEGSPNNMNFIP